MKNRQPERWRDRRQIAHAGDVIVNVINYASNQSGKGLDINEKPVELPAPVNVSENTD